VLVGDGDVLWERGWGRGRAVEAGRSEELLWRERGIVVPATFFVVGWGNDECGDDGTSSRGFEMS
jgi:hypothetical protein